MQTKKMFIDDAGILGNFMTAETLIGKSIAILGIPESGKSNSAAVLMEELLERNVPIAVVDPAGEYHSLKQRYDITVVGKSVECEVDIKADSLNASRIAHSAYMAGKSVVIDVSGMMDDAREAILFTYFSTVRQLSVKHRIPCVIFLEECHNWIPQKGKAETSDLFTRIASEDRKRGLSLVMISQRAARVEKDTLTAADIAFLHKVRFPADMTVYAGIMPISLSQVKKKISRLKKGEAYVMFGDRQLRAQMRLRHTKSVGATPTMASIPQATQLSLIDLI